MLSACQTGACDTLFADNAAIPRPEAAQAIEGQDKAVCLKWSVPLPLERNAR